MSKPTRRELELIRAEALAELKEWYRRKVAQDEAQAEKQRASDAKSAETTDV
jgi:hypothetical protein